MVLRCNSVTLKNTGSQHCGTGCEISSWHPHSDCRQHSDNNLDIFDSNCKLDFCLIPITTMTLLRVPNPGVSFLNVWENTQVAHVLTNVVLWNIRADDLTVIRNKWALMSIAKRPKSKNGRHCHFQKLIFEPEHFLGKSSTRIPILNWGSWPYYVPFLNLPLCSTPSPTQADPLQETSDLAAPS